MARSGDKACKFVVSAGHKGFPPTYRGLIEARLLAKRLSSRDGTKFDVRLMCWGGPGTRSRGVNKTFETCSRKSCE